MPIKPIKVTEETHAWLKRRRETTGQSSSFVVGKAIAALIKEEDAEQIPIDPKVAHAQLECKRIREALKEMIDAAIDDGWFSQRSSPQKRAKLRNAKKVISESECK